MVCGCWGWSYVNLILFRHFHDSIEVACPLLVESISPWWIVLLVQKFPLSWSGGCTVMVIFNSTRSFFHLCFNMLSWATKWLQSGWSMGQCVDLKSCYIFTLHHITVYKCYFSSFSYSSLINYNQLHCSFLFSSSTVRTVNPSSLCWQIWQVEHKKLHEIWKAKDPTS